MALTRWYLSDTAYAGPSPSGFAWPSWDDTASAVTRQLTSSKAGSPTSVSVAETSASTSWDALMGRWISPPALQAGTLPAGASPLTVAISMSDPAAALRVLWNVGLIDASGTLVATGFALLLGANMQTSPTAITLNMTWDSDVAVEVGDRFVFEVGYRATNSVTTSYSGSLRYGGTAVGELENGDTGADATTLSPWIEMETGRLFEPLPTTPFAAVGDDGLIGVDVAWGADLDADPDTWVWSDITADVLQANGGRISMRHGGGDESGSTQPATCNMLLDNSSGAYGLGAQGANWPYVRRNTPVRVRVVPGAVRTAVDQFVGFADTWAPEFDVTGRYAGVKLSASGTLRRLLQGDSPVLSSLRRAMSGFSTLIAYWPCEDGSNAKLFSPAREGDIPMSIVGDVRAAANSDFACSAPLPTLNGSAWTGTVQPGYTHTGEILVRLLASWPSGGDSVEDGRVILRVLCTGTVRQWDIYYRTVDGALGIAGYSASGAEVVNSGFVQFRVNGQRLRMEMALSQDGTAVDYRIGTLAVEASTGSFIDGTETSSTLGRVTHIIVNPDGNFSNVAVGHVSVQNELGDMFEVQEQLNAYVGENALVRMQRLADENAVPLDITGSSDVRMSVQTVAPLLALLRECEAADDGMLYDGVTAGLTYTTRSVRENQAAALTINAAAGEARDVAPIDDDQRNVNRALVSRLEGGSGVFEDTDGPLGTRAIGIYDSSQTISFFEDSRAVDRAAWIVHEGTVEGYRYPTLGLKLHADRALAPALTRLVPGQRADITGLSDVRSQLPAGTYAALVEGMAQHLSQLTWDVTLNLSPYQPWAIAAAAADTGSTGEFVARGRPDASALAAGAAQGATSLSVATSDGPLWVASADDADSFPFDVSIAGIRVTVTAITGASSPQTFTVTGVTKALPDGSAVDLWYPPALGL